MKYIKLYEKIENDFAKSLKVGDIFKYNDDGCLFIAKVINKYKDISICIVMILFYNYKKEWQYARDKSYRHPNSDQINYFGSPITDKEMEEIELFISAKKYNL